jgi:hypothetical protein
VDPQGRCSLARFPSVRGTRPFSAGTVGLRNGFVDTGDERNSLIEFSVVALPVAVIRRKSRVSSSHAMSPRSLATRLCCSLVQAGCAKREIEVRTLTAGKTSLAGHDAVENDRSIEGAANSIGDGIVLVVSIDENRNNAGDLVFSLVSRPGSL